MLRQVMPVGLTRRPNWVFCFVAAVSLALRTMPAAADDATSLSVEDPRGAARQALAQGRFDEVLRLAPDAPGLVGAALEGKGDINAACAVYESDRASGALRAMAASLRAARCRARRGDVGGALAAYAEIGSSPLGADPRVLAEVAAFVDAAGLALPAAVLQAVDVPVTPFDVDRREALARALSVVHARGPSPQRDTALLRLQSELFNTEAGRRAPSAALDNLEAALPRARTLDAVHDSAALLALLKPLVNAHDFTPAGCEARLLMGKAERKLRRYAAAKSLLQHIVGGCVDDTKRRAQFLEARVALIGKQKGGVALGERFVADFPNDTLTDDMLLQLAEAKEAAGDEAGAQTTYRKLIERFADGDMVHEARFKLALALAAGGDTAGSQQVLDDAARLAGERVDVADRALYWRARLRAFPRLDELTPTSDATARAEASRALQKLALSRPASFYGHLARLMLRQQLSTTDLAAPAEKLRAQLRGGVHPAALARDGAFASVRAFVDGGYDDEAAMLLATLPITSPNGGLKAAAADDLIAVAVLLDRIGAPGAGHALLRSAGRALLPGQPGEHTLVAWSVGWPRAYPQAIHDAAAAQRVPAALLMAIAREESAFDADIVSWAGAIGLCQLMLPTAKDEAKALRLPPPTVDDLRAPELNALLGAAHIGRRLRGMKNPLFAIAAYNAGPGAVAQWRPRGPIDTFVERIPIEETRNYVKKVTGSWVTYSALDASADDVDFRVVLP
jgi:soluble lytic murein transglycosylase